MRHRIKVPALLLLATIGLMAFAATAAQAGEYTLNGGSFTSKGVASESVSGTISAGKILVPGLALTFSCTGGTVSGTVLLGGVSHLSTLYSGCSVEGNKLCKIFATKAKMESETESGFISISGLAHVILMGEEHYLLLLSGEVPLGTIYLTKSAKGCVLPLEEPLRGVGVSLILDALTALIEHTCHPLSAMETALLFPEHFLEYGNQPASLDGGSTTVSLSGANKGQKWGFSNAT